MTQVIGFACFFIAVGITIMMFLPSKLCGGVVAVLLVIIGFNLFCCHNKKKC